MNKQLLRAHMIKNGDTQQKLAEALGMTLSRLSERINGRGTEFRQSEIQTIKIRYSLTDEEVADIFFDESVAS